MTNKPYADYKFVGIKPFIQSLEDADVEYILFPQDRGAENLFNNRPDYFHRGEDSIIVGKCLSGGLEIYFAEFGMKITKSYRSYIVFIYDHHPTSNDILLTADDIERLVAERLDSMQPEDITSIQ